MPSSWRGETFLALDAGDRSQDNVDGLRALLGPPERVVETPFHTVLVYDHNIIGGCEPGEAMTKPLDPSRARVEIVSVSRASDHGRPPGNVVVALRNETGGGISGIGAYPISIGIRLLDGTGAVRDPDWVHFPLGCAMESGERRAYVVPLPVIPDGNWTAQVDLVQEGVAWFHQWGRPTSSISLTIEDTSVNNGDEP